MPKKNLNSRALRQLADDLLRGIAEEFEITEDERRDLATALVRQWVTYDGHATLFLAGQQVHFLLGKTPLGRPRVVPEPDLSGWLEKLVERWKIPADELADLFAQLNRGQSAEVTNGEGVPLRLWVDPREKGLGVESLAEQPVPAVVQRDYHRLALDALAQQFGPDSSGPELDAEELEVLARSLVRQWQKYDGHACLFLEDGHVLFTVAEQDQGFCRVGSVRKTGTLGPLLEPLGVPAEIVPEVMVRFNLGQEVEFQDGRGVRFRLWNDPKAKRVGVQPIDPPASGAPSSSPLFCPACGAVLRPWQRSERQQRCPLCGHTVALS